jgi:hypothetical protein
LIGHDSGPGNQVPVSALRLPLHETVPMTFESIRTESHLRPAGTALLLLLYAAMWVLQRPYEGLVGDAQLYALQALATLDPGIFSGDIFLKYGSQNDFTLFPRAYALVVRGIGLEHAAAFLTLVCSLAWLAMGWCIARRLTNKEAAWVALGLLIAVRAWYGAHQVFRGGEMYMSARLPAEAFSLAAIAAWLGARRALAVALLLIAGALHPLMALPVAMLFFFVWVEKHWGMRGLAALFPALILLGTAATLVLSGRGAASPGEWLPTLRIRSLFLFPVNWRGQDWLYFALVLATVSMACASARSRTLAGFSSSTVLLGLLGIGLSAIAAAMPEHAALLRIQPSRWLWPVVVAALVLLPGTIGQLWREETQSEYRTCAILMVAAWLTMDTFGGITAVTAFAIFCGRGRLPHSALRSLRAGAWLILAAAIASVATVVWQCALYPLDSNREPRWMQQLVNAVPTDSAAVATVFSCWVLARRVSGSKPLVVPCVACAAALLLALMPRAHRTWTTERFSPATYSAFAQWRSIIPKTSEVLWHEDSTGVWVLLERRSYLSVNQLAGLLYSPNMAPEVARRAEALKPLVSPDWWAAAPISDHGKPKQLTPTILAQICRAPGLGYVVDKTDVGGYVATATIPVAMVQVYLYDCRALNQRRDRT